MNIVIEEKPPSESTVLDYDNYSQNTTVANEINYSLNYTLPMLQHICNFYELPYNRIKKKDLISSLVVFESLIENMEVVEERKRLWYYMEQLKQNKYLSKYIISM
tara:strand:- start:3507 stop:3821 length:315 start_codon:yes stop_codon:yes gene_type:complete